jgi:hypothetical protein
VVHGAHRSAILADMQRAAIALVTAVGFATACGPSWPRPVAAVDPAMTSHATAITHVDLLPVDLAVWGRGNPDEIRLRAESAIVGAATAALYERGYQLGAQLHWDGGFIGDDGVPRGALTPDELLGTVSVLSAYHGEAVRLGGLPQPPLPARLGASGAQATLYVGGWSYVGDDTSGAGKVLKVAVIAAVIVVVVVAVLAIAKSKGHGDSAIGNAAAGVAHVAAATGRVAVKGLAHAGNVAIEVGRGTATLADVLFHVTPGRAMPRMLRPDLDWYVTSRDPYGPPAWQLTAPPPAWDRRPAQPRSGHSSLYLEMTLVDNRDGHVLWHVAARFPASGASDADVGRAARSMLSTLPALR